MNTKLVKSLNSFKSMIQKMYDFVKAHGGELNVETSKGKETTFKIKIPLS